MNKKVIIYGKHSVKSVLQNPNRKIEKILCTQATVQLTENTNKSLVSVVNRNSIEQTLASYGIQNALHQDIVVISQRLNQPDLHEILNSSNFLVLLDELQDSQNIGAIMRSAALFDASAVISTLHNSPDENSHIIKAASGAFEHLPFIKIINLAQTIKLLQENNFWVIGMSCDGKESIDMLRKKFSKQEKIAIVVGNEENGMRKLVEKSCDFLVTIPMNIERGVNSLNASAAAAIFLYEIHKIFAS